MRIGARSSIGTPGALLRTGSSVLPGGQYGIQQTDLSSSTMRGSFKIDYIKKKNLENTEKAGRGPVI